MDCRIASTSSGSSDGTGGALAAGTGASRPRAPSLMNPDMGANNSTHQPIKCPRCDSLNTKFCYYNNYSQTQPRHFCKSCRRYWTEGGALRNVPVGGGCRKNKRVKQRPLINLGVATGLLDPSSLIDETTSNMLARLSNTSPFPGLLGSSTSSFGSEDTSSQLLNIAFSHFQESMRRRQQQPGSDQSPETTPYFDMSFPALVHKQGTPSSCSCGACGNRAHSIHHGACGGLMSSFENANLGFSGLPVKMEHDVGLGGFCNNAYELNSIYHEQNAGMHMVGTSATATLASIEDQLSSFSNLQHVDTCHGDASTTVVEDKSCGPLEGLPGNVVSGPLQLLGSAEKGASTSMESAFADETQDRMMHIHMLDDKSLLGAANNELSSNMMQSAAENNWQPASLMMNEMMFEPHHGMWNSHTTRSWQDNIHSLAATSATAGSVL